MNKVKVSYYGLMFKTILNDLEEECQLPDGATVKDLLELLVARHGDEFRDLFLTPEWQLIPDTTVLVNECNINEGAGLETKLKDNSEISITVMMYTIDGG